MRTKRYIFLLSNVRNVSIKRANTNVFHEIFGCFVFFVYFCERMKRLFTILAIQISLLTTMMAQPQFSLPHGLYDEGPLTVTLRSKDASSEIRYTIDGSTPTAQSIRYTTPLVLSKTTILRAVEVKDGEVVSSVSTASYLFTSSMLSQSNTPEGYPSEWGKYTQIDGKATADYGMNPEMTSDATLRVKIVEGFHDLPIVSLVSDKENFFNPENDETTGGIYIFTGPPVGDTTGDGWTRPASVELIGGPQNHDLSVTCGMRLHGGHSRLAEKNPKHSFRLVFKDRYGPKTLQYPVFGPDTPSKFDQLVLRCHFGNSWQHWDENSRMRAQYSRDVWARRMQRRMGLTSVDALYVHLFLNGMYWGLYNIAERVDDRFGKDQLGGKKSDIDVIKIEDEGGRHIEATEGSLDIWNELLSTATDAANPKSYARLDTLLDIGNFIDYMLINQYDGNTDWDHHNWYAIRRQGPESQGFRFLCWDSESIFEEPNENLSDGSSREGFPTTLFRQLLSNEDFAKRYLLRAKTLLANDGLLGPSSVVEVWDSLYHTIARAVYCEAARWGNYRHDVHLYTSQGQLYTVDDHYMAERRRLLEDYFPVRSQIVLADIAEYVCSKTGIDIESIADDIRTLHSNPVVDDAYFTLQGQKVLHPVKGLYIHRGKLIVIRH